MVVKAGSVGKGGDEETCPARLPVGSSSLIPLFLSTPLSLSITGVLPVQAGGVVIPARAGVYGQLVESAVLGSMTALPLPSPTSPDAGALLAVTDDAAAGRRVAAGVLSRVAGVDACCGEQVLPRAPMTSAHTILNRHADAHSHGDTCCLRHRPPFYLYQVLLLRGSHRSLLC